MRIHRVGLYMRIHRVGLYTKMYAGKRTGAGGAAAARCCSVTQQNRMFGMRGLRSLHEGAGSLRLHSHYSEVYIGKMVCIQIFR